MKYNTHDHMMTRLPAARGQHLCKAQLDTVSLDAICVFSLLRCTLSKMEVVYCIDSNFVYYSASINEGRFRFV